MYDSMLNAQLGIISLFYDFSLLVHILCPVLPLMAAFRFLYIDLC
jgi:hypothetical protein